MSEFQGAIPMEITVKTRQGSAGETANVNGFPLNYNKKSDRVVTPNMTNNSRKIEITAKLINKGKVTAKCT